MIIDILKAIIELGLPLALLSWLIFMRLFISGELDRQSDRKGIERGVKKIKASFKGEKKRTFAEKSKTDLMSRVLPIRRIHSQNTSTSRTLGRSWIFRRMSVSSHP